MNTTVNCPTQLLYPHCVQLGNPFIIPMMGAHSRGSQLFTLYYESWSHSPHDMRPVTLLSQGAHYYAPCDSPRPIVSLDLTSDTHSHSFRMKVPSECQATACDALSVCLARVYALHPLCPTTPRYAMFPVLVPRLPLCTLRCSRSAIAFSASLHTTTRATTLGYR